jgi:hypothetical protein
MNTVEFDRTRPGLFKALRRLVARTRLPSLPSIILTRVAFLVFGSIKATFER